MNNAYIFLDIDGIMCTDNCSTKEYHPLFFYPFHATCVSIFNKILSETKAEVVLTSDWRLHYDSDLKWINDLFKHNGVIKSPIDITPDLSKNRNQEISSYIYKHDLKRFLILDDMPLTINSLRFIRTNTTDALMGKGIMEKAISILNNDQSDIHTCLNCELEYRSKGDDYACSDICRKEIEEMKKNYKTPITDSEISEFALNNKVSLFYIKN